MLQRDFGKWLYNKNNLHAYWVVAHVDEEDKENIWCLF